MGDASSAVAKMLETYANRQADVANGITAFAVVQSLTFLFLLLQNDTVREQARKGSFFLVVSAATLVFGIGYGYAIRWLHGLELCLLNTRFDDHLNSVLKHAVNGTECGRLLTIVSFLGAQIIGLAIYYFTNRPQTTKSSDTAETT